MSAPEAPERPVAALVSRVRRIAESPEMAAIQWSLPRSFIGLGIGLAIFMATQPGTPLVRFSESFTAAFGIMSASLLVLLTIDLARRRQVPRIAAATIASIAFLLSLPYGKATSAFTLARALGSSGLFLGLGISLITVGVMRFAQRRTNRILGACLAALVVVGGATALFAAGFSLTGALNVAIAPLGRLGDSLQALLAITAVEALLWTIGIHGPALLAPVVLPVYISLQLQNTQALAHDLPLPHIVTVSTFLFVFPGGAGATLPLVLLLARSKSARIRRVARATLLPSLINVNEPLMFGLPLVLNPVLAVPFVAAPIALALVSYEAIAIGLVSRPAYYIPSALPTPLAAFLATKDWRSIVLVFAEVGLGCLIYLPFVNAYEKQERSRGPSVTAT